MLQVSRPLRSRLEFKVFNAPKDWIHCEVSGVRLKPSITLEWMKKINGLLHFSTRWRKVMIWLCLDQIGNPTHELPCNFIGDYMEHVLWVDRLHMDRVRTYLGT